MKVEALAERRGVWASLRSGTPLPGQWARVCAGLVGVLKHTLRPDPTIGRGLKWSEKTISDQFGGLWRELLVLLGDSNSPFRLKPGQPKAPPESPRGRPGRPPASKQPLEPACVDLGVPHCRLDGTVAEVRLDRPEVGALIHQLVARGMPQHVGMDVR